MVCDVGADCCVGSVYTDAFSCPGAYPNNWACVAGACINECGSNSDCVLPGWQCLPVGGIDTCFMPCTVTSGCNQETMPGTQCDGQADNNILFCKPAVY